jgi:SAM-dependent methyltransferase
MAAVASRDRAARGVSRLAGKVSRVAARVSAAALPGGGRDGDRSVEDRVHRAYNLVLGRPADPEALARYADQLRRGALTDEGLASQLVQSPEFRQRLTAPPADIDAHVLDLSDDDVDVRTLLTELSLDELSEAADDYYVKNLANADYYFAKPLGSIDEAPDLLACFAQVLGVLRPLPGMRVVDFGAGTCWSTRWLTQLGCSTVAVDVSQAALDVGRQLFERMPVAGDRPAPEFLRFDGRRIHLPDESADRVVCLDALHHVPNPGVVLAELGRILKPGGMAAFTEPGPDHSRTAQSQFEMRNYTVVENDMVMADVWREASAAGFTRLQLAVFSSEPFLLDVPDYEDFLGGGGTTAAFAEHIRRFALERRIFFLSKGEATTSDSRDRRGLLADLAVRLERPEVDAGGTVRGTAEVRNTGTSVWLPSSTPLGGVKLGVHLYDESGLLVDRDFARAGLPGNGVLLPGEAATVALAVPAPGTGRWQLGFDLVAEGVCWFEVNGAETVTVPLEVR